MDCNSKYAHLPGVNLACRIMSHYFDPAILFCVGSPVSTCFPSGFKVSRAWKCDRKVDKCQERRIKEVLIKACTQSYFW